MKSANLSHSQKQPAVVQYETAMNKDIYLFLSFSHTAKASLFIEVHIKFSMSQGEQLDTIGSYQKRKKNVFMCLYS